MCCLFMVNRISNLSLGFVRFISFCSFCSGTVDAIVVEYDECLLTLTISGSGPFSTLPEMEVVSNSCLFKCG